MRGNNENNNEGNNEDNNENNYGYNNETKMINAMGKMTVSDRTSLAIFT